MLNLTQLTLEAPLLKPTVEGFNRIKILGAIR